MSLWGAPFGAVSTEAGDRVMRISRAVLEHHGHAGPAFVRFLLANRSQWQEWRAEHGRLQLDYARRAGDHPVGTRIAGHLATLTLAARLAAAAEDLLPSRDFDPVDSLWDALLGESAGADQATESLTYAVDWATSHASRFFKTFAAKGDDEPGQGWAGRWDREQADSGGESGYLGFFRACLTEVLTEGGFNYEETVRAWDERGWLRTTPGSTNRTLQVRMGPRGGRPWLVAINSKALEVVHGSEPSSEGRSPPERL